MAKIIYLCSALIFIQLLYELIFRGMGQNVRVGLNAVFIYLCNCYYLYILKLFKVIFNFQVHLRERRI